MIKKLIDKVDEDLGAISFILRSIKEIEIKTDFLIKEQEEDIKRMREQYRNFQILEIMLNRFDMEGSTGQKFLQCKTLIIDFNIANGFEALRQGKPEETFNELIMKNKKKRDKKLGELSSVSSSRGGDNQIQSKLEKLQRDLNRRLKLSNAAGGQEDDDEDEENLTSQKISKKINNIIEEGLIDVKVKPKYELDQDAADEIAQRNTFLNSLTAKVP